MLEVTFNKVTLSGSYKRVEGSYFERVLKDFTIGAHYRIEVYGNKHYLVYGDSMLPLSEEELRNFKLL